MKHVWYYSDGDECGETFAEGSGFAEKFLGTKDGVFLGGGYEKDDPSGVNGKVYVAPAYLAGSIEGRADTWKEADESVETGCKP
jgi:hypothetical protein